MTALYSGGFPQAIHAAQEVVRGGDFFKFFDRLHPQYMDAITPVNKEGLPAGIGDVEARAERIRRSIELFRRVMEVLNKAKTPEDCGEHENVGENSVRAGPSRGINRHDKILSLWLHKTSCIQYSGAGKVRPSCDFGIQSKENGRYVQCDGNLLNENRKQK